jgi:hypothetical protein
MRFLNALFFVLLVASFSFADDSSLPPPRSESDLLRERVFAISSERDSLRVLAGMLKSDLEKVKASWRYTEAKLNEIQLASKIVEVANPKPAAVVVSSVIVKPVATVVSRSVTVGKDNKSGHWTYPGEITSHLMSDHKTNASGLSKEQKLTIHDQLHEGKIVSVSSPARTVTTPIASYPVVVSQPVRKYMPMPVYRQPSKTYQPIRVWGQTTQSSSSCPGGNCPQRR